MLGIPFDTVLLDHIAFCKPPSKDDESCAFSELLKLSRFPKVYVKFSPLFRASRMPFPYTNLSDILPKLISSFGANRIMWGSDFPFVVPECGYKGGKEAIPLVREKAWVTYSDMEYIWGENSPPTIHWSLAVMTKLVSIDS